MEKICNICNIKKLIQDFRKNSRSKDGYYSLCKQCESNNKKQYYLNKKKFQPENDDFINIKENFIQSSLLLADSIKVNNSTCNILTFIEQMQLNIDIFKKKYDESMLLNVIKINKNNMDDNLILSKIQNVIYDKTNKILSPNDIKINIIGNNKFFILPFNISDEIKNKILSQL